ncbi:hypothetical protein [Egicoccus sp. AB-alg6-2]|uniref:hypothetical protein n=1 Tax=Egicoccus sp. AB-alg6-2 TaxID=3242692 RepID=UPI00359CD0EE
MRFQAVHGNRHGIRPGVFALVNGLAFDGRLTEAQQGFRRDTNAWYTRNYTNPADVVPDIYSHQLNPGATSWFKVSAAYLLERVEGYLEVLRAHAVNYEVVFSTQPGRIVYEDADQVVVVPWDATPCPACDPTRRLWAVDQP